MGLESPPERYDRGIRVLDGGAIDGVYQRLAELVAKPGARVLDVGSGTGNVAIACAARGASIHGPATAETRSTASKLRNSIAITSWYVRRSARPVCSHRSDQELRRY